ncbi:phage major capsid protein [Faecalibacterium duncaniae]|uniref:phage major capsid protein n=1 Tax=Faecalibacterium duncaniae (strain DSM 17677 / JCM 31915 / A2-165) TaxID=411483 RepID=UPI0032C12F5D
MAIDAIARNKAEALIREQLVNTIQQDVPKSSIVMQLGTRLANMTSNQTKIPVLSMLPLAYWVNGDTGMKKTSKQEWDNVYMTAAELAVIVPVPEAVLADSSFDIMGEVQPRVREAMGAKIDNAILFGGDRPTEWTTDVLTLAAKNKVTGPIDYTKLLGKDGLFSKVEAGGFGVDAVVGDLTAKAELRGLLDTNGRPLFRSDMQGATTYALDGAPMYFPENGGFDASKAQLIAGNFKKLVYSIRQDVTVKLLDQGVIQDPSTKEIVYNLAQQDMVALRVVMRMGWALPNHATRMNADRSKVPFAFLTAATVAA